MEAETRIAIESDADVVTARQRARELAGELELSSTDQTLLATAISEVARNITHYATRGEVLLRVVRDGDGRSGIQVVASDDGPGIADIERALQDGYTTGGGLGLGLPGARRLVDDFDIQSTPSEGTTVTLVDVGARPPPGACVPEDAGWPAALERGEAGAPLAGESRSGDLAVFAPYDGGALVATIDGLGHGDAAADAAEAAAVAVPRAPRRSARAPAQALPRRAAQHARRGRDARLVRPRRGRADLDRGRQRRGPARACRPPGRRRPTPPPSSAACSAGRCPRSGSCARRSRPATAW